METQPGRIIFASFLLLLTTTVHSATVTYSFDGLAFFSPFGGPNELNFNVSMSIEITPPTKLEGNCTSLIGDCIATYSGAANWTINMDHYGNLNPIPGTTEASVHNDSSGDFFEITAQLDPVHVSGSSYITDILFRAPGDWTLFHNTDLPTSLSDFDDVYELQFWPIVDSDLSDENSVKGAVISSNTDGFLTNFNVTVVPLPAGFYLFCSGLIMLIVRLIRTNK